MQLKKQQGVVIVMALFIIALVAAISYVMMARLERDTHRTTLLLRNAEAELYAEGSLAWAKDQLRMNIETQKKNRLIDRTPISSGINDVNGYKIESIIYDMQARFNLNNLAQLESHAAFAGLLKALAPEIGESAQRALINAINSWITTARKESNDLDQYYLELPTPYRASHRPLVDVNELNLIKGINNKLFTKLRPYIVALPNMNTKINIQTAPLPVLLTLAPGVTAGDAKAFIEKRQADPITSFEQLAATEFAKKYQISDKNAVVVSDYFLVETKVRIENQERLLYTLLERVVTENKAVMTVLWQIKGSW